MTWLSAFLARVRRRLRGLWLVSTMVWFAPVVAGAAALLVAIGRVRPWAWPETAAIAVVGIAAVAVSITAFVLRVPDSVAARAADRGLGSRDGIATAVEIEPDHGPFAALVHERAQALTTGVDLRRALPLRVAPRRLVAGGALGALALIGGVAGNPQDDVRRQRAADQAAIAAAADDVEAAAEALAERLEPEAEAEAIVAELEALAAALDEASTLDEARELLDRAEAALQAGLTPESLARKAAVSGLERSTAATPLPGAQPGDTAAAQLDAAAAALEGLDEGAQADLAERLERLAETQAVGSPAAAGALGQAAAALGEGDIAAAAGALADAANAHRTAAAGAAADDGRRSALGTVDGARRALQGDGQRQGQGDGEGNGDGDGDGSGQGQGEGQGQGNGQGQGQGNGGQGGQNPNGGASGPVAGAQGGNGAGQGGQGTAQGTPGADPVGEEARTDEPSLFDPQGSGDDEVALGGTPTGDDPGEVVGRGDGLSTTGSAFVPLSQALDSFRQRVTTALDDPVLSPSMRELVRSYFGRLTEGGSR